jgi:hypothetical protein
MFKERNCVFKGGQIREPFEVFEETARFSARFP